MTLLGVGGWAVLHKCASVTSVIPVLAGTVTGP